MPNVSSPSDLSPIGGKVQGGWNFPSSKVTWFKLKCISIRWMLNVELASKVNMCAYNFFVGEPKFTKFFCSTGMNHPW